MPAINFKHLILQSIFKTRLSAKTAAGIPALLPPPPAPSREVAFAGFVRITVTEIAQDFHPLPFMSEDTVAFMTRTFYHKKRILSNRDGIILKE